MLISKIQGGFFDAHIDTNGTPDRVYSAIDYASLFDGVISDGIFPHSDMDTKPMDISNDGKDVSITKGRAWVNGHWAYIPNTITINTASWPEPGSGKMRVYALYLYYSENNRGFTLEREARQGDPDAKPEWYADNCLPSLSKGDPSDALYTLGYLVMRHNGSTVTRDVYTAIYSNLSNYSTDDYMHYIRNKNDLDHKIFYATPYASAFMDLEADAESRIRNVEDTLSTVYGWASTLYTSKSAYDEAYNRASLLYASKPNYDYAFSWAKVFSSNKASYDSAYTWANIFMSNKSSYDEAYTKAGLAYEAAFPSEGGQLPETISRVNALWSKKSDYDMAWTLANAWHGQNLYDIVAYMNLVSRRTGLFSVDTDTLISASLKTVFPILNVNTSEGNWYPYQLFLAIVNIQFAKNESSSWPSTISGRHIRAKASYSNGAGGLTEIDLNDGEALIYTTNDLASRTTTLQTQFLVPGFNNNDTNKILQKVYLQVVQSPSSDTLRQTVKTKIWLVPLGTPDLDLVIPGML